MSGASRMEPEEAPVDEQVKVLIDTFSSAKIPILRRSRLEIQSLIKSGSASAPALADLLSHDPLLSACILRKVSRSPDRLIGTLEQAVLLLGESALLDMVENSPGVDDLLTSARRARFVAQCHYAYLCGHLARHWAFHDEDLHYAESFVAASLHDLAALMLEVCSPQQAPRTNLLPTANLNAALARAWNLPQLLQEALDADALIPRRAMLVNLACLILRDAPLGFDGPVQQARLHRVAEMLKLPAVELQTDIFRQAVAAIREIKDWLAMDISSFIPLFPVLQEAVPVAVACPLPRQDAGEDAAPRSWSSPGQLIQARLSDLSEQAGLSRIVFALLTPDHASLQGRYFHGVEAGSGLHQFQFERGKDEFFFGLLSGPQVRWIRAGEQRSTRLQASHELQSYLEMREFFVASLFVSGKPLGICYADRGSPDCGLDGHAFEQFRSCCDLISRELNIFSHSA